MTACERVVEIGKRLKLEKLSLFPRRKLVAGLAALVLGLILLTACDPASGFRDISNTVDTGPQPASTVRDVNSSLVYLNLNFEQALADGRTYKSCTGVFTGQGEITTVGHCVKDYSNNLISPVFNVDYLFMTNGSLKSGSNPMNTSSNKSIVTLILKDPNNQQRNYIPISDKTPRIGEELYIVTTDPEAINFAEGSETFTRPRMWPFKFTGETVADSTTSDCIAETCYVSRLEPDNVLLFGNSGSPVIRYNVQKKIFEVVGFASARDSIDRNTLIYILAAGHQAEFSLP